MNIDELVRAAAAAMNMPESMVRKSAEARAAAAGRPVEEILGEWAGVDPSAEPTSEAAAPAEAAAPDEAPAPADAPAPTTAPAAVDSGDLLARAAEAQGMPEAMVKRSAAARAKAEGKSTDEILADWAGVEPPPAGAAPAAAAATAAEPTAAAAPAPAEPETTEIEVIAEEPEEVVDDGEKERELVTPSGALPRWLAALFVAVPLFAVAYAGFLPNGPNCGDAGQLAVDPVTGVVVECDGSEYGSEELDFLAIGAEVFGARCAVCHGPSGGGGTGPEFIGGALVSTFPEGSCDQHQTWVALGSSGWPDPTYGATGKPVGGFGALMPGFGGTLSEQELQSVVLFERVQFGGLSRDSAEIDCGLVDPEDEAESG